jgi:hypothetical protein
MDAPQPDMLGLAAGLASAAGALSAIAFAFLQAAAARRAQWSEERLALSADIRRKLAAVNQHLRLWGVERAISIPAPDIGELERNLLSALRTIILGIDRSLMGVFDEYSASPLETLGQYLASQAGSHRSEVESLMRYFAGEFQADLTHKMARVKSLDAAIDEVRTQERQLHILVIWSSLALLALCAAAVPKLGWGLEPFVFFMGITSVYCFYISLFLESLQEHLQQRGSGWFSGEMLAAGVSCAAAFVLYGVVIAKALFDL